VAATRPRARVNGTFETRITISRIDIALAVTLRAARSMNPSCLSELNPSKPLSRTFQRRKYCCTNDGRPNDGLFRRARRIRSPTSTCDFVDLSRRSVIRRHGIARQARVNLCSEQYSRHVGTSDIRRVAHRVHDATKDSIGKCELPNGRAHEG